MLVQRFRVLLLLAALLLNEAVAAFASIPPASVSDRVVHVGNLDWNVPQDVVRQELQHALNKGITSGNAASCVITMKEVPTPVKSRDADKFHAGSATIAFADHDAALCGIQALSSNESSLHSNWRVKWARTFDSFQKRGAIPQVEPELSLEQQERRKRRAESYARRRVRVAEQTDRIIAMMLRPCTPNGEYDIDTATAAVPTLEAPELNWLTCPQAADPCRGGGLQVASSRGQRKRAAAEAFLHVLVSALLPSAPSATAPRSSPRHLVADLGCGAGNLSLSLAYWLQTVGYGVLGVDTNRQSLDRLTNRAQSLQLDIKTLQLDLQHLVPSSPVPTTPQTTIDGSLLDECVAVVSLHACGSASDLAIGAAVSNGLPFAISPCCIGKVKSAWQPGTMPQKSKKLSSTNESDEDKKTTSIVYPRSMWLQNRIDAEEYNLLACAADYGVDYNTDANDDPYELARRKRCQKAKHIVERDRLEWACEHGYYVRMLELPRIGPLYPKGELLLGAPLGSCAADRISILAVHPPKR